MTTKKSISLTPYAERILIDTYQGNNFSKYIEKLALIGLEHEANHDSSIKIRMATMYGEYTQLLNKYNRAKALIARLQNKLSPGLDEVDKEILSIKRSGRLGDIV